MSQAYKCDKCKQFKEGKKHGSVTTYEDAENDNDGFGATTRQYDLCYDCFKSITKSLVLP